MSPDEARTLPGNLVVVGAQWGDEGKGKIVDHCAASADVVVRFQGGTNAGHTLVVDGRQIILHLIPSGILRSDKACVIGPGCVVNPTELVDEIRNLSDYGVSVDPERLRVSQTANVILPWHEALDRAREAAAGEARIGTTGRGIGPTYEDLVSRRGIRFCDLEDRAALSDRVERLLVAKNRELVALGCEPLTAGAIIEPLLAASQVLKPFLCDSGEYLDRRLRSGAKLLFEGAQGTMLDVLHGTYPYVTSSQTVSAFAATSSGLGPNVLDSILGVSKAYCTRVGGGPFPTELTGEEGDLLREVGGEYGATTGRPRRCGWLDVAALRYASRLNGLTAIAITKLDVLSGMETIRVAVAYERDGVIQLTIPTTPADLAAAVPIYEELEGWQGDLSSVRRFCDLPSAAQAYVDRIELLLGVPIALIGVGPSREQTFHR